MSKASEPRRSRDPFELVGFPRFLVGVLALGSSALGVYLALWDPDARDIVVVAFLALGLIFALSAMSGRLPKALGFGGASASYSEAERALTDSQDEAPEGKRRIANQLVSDAVSPSESRVRAEAAATIRLEAFLEEDVLAQLGEIDGIQTLTDREEVAVGTPGKGAPMRLDAVIVRNGKRWAVEIANPNLSVGYMSPIERLTRALEHGRFAGGLLIVPNDTALERFANSRRIRVVEASKLKDELLSVLDSLS